MFIYHPVDNQIQAAHIIPGTIVAMNNAPTDADDTEAKIIALTFGGIINPKGLDAAINAARYALLYPFFLTPVPLR